jgi:hypothetical protein
MAAKFRQYRAHRFNIDVTKERTLAVRHDRNPRQ